MLFSSWKKNMGNASEYFGEVPNIFLCSPLKKWGKLGKRAFKKTFWAKWLRIWEKKNGDRHVVFNAENIGNDPNTLGKSQKKFSGHLRKVKKCENMQLLDHVMWKWHRRDKKLGCYSIFLGVNLFSGHPVPTYELFWRSWIVSWLLDLAVTSYSKMSLPHYGGHDINDRISFRDPEDWGGYTWLWNYWPARTLCLTAFSSWVPLIRSYRTKPCLEMRSISAACASLSREASWPLDRAVKWAVLNIHPTAGNAAKYKRNRLYFAWGWLQPYKWLTPWNDYGYIHDYSSGSQRCPCHAHAQVPGIRAYRLGM